MKTHMILFVNITMPIRPQDTFCTLGQTGAIRFKIFPCQWKFTGILSGRNERGAPVIVLIRKDEPL